jgi:hypothetical protein
VRKSYFLLLLLLAGCLPNRPPPDWNTYRSEESGLALDSPYPIQFEPLDKEKKEESSILWGHANNSGSFIAVLAEGFGDILSKKPVHLSFFRIDAYCYRMNTKSKHYDSEKILDSRKKWLSESEEKRGSKNIQFAHKPVRCSGMPAILLTASFDRYGKSGKFVGTNFYYDLFVIKDQQLWTVSITHGNKVKFEEVTQRILDSVKITPKGK